MGQEGCRAAHSFGWQVAGQRVSYGGGAGVALQPGGDSGCEVGRVAGGQEQVGVAVAEAGEEVGGGLEEARSLKEASLPALRRARPLAAAATLDDLGDIAADQGHWEDSRALHLEAMAIFETEGEAAGVVHSRAGLGRLDLMEGDLVGAREHYERVLAKGRTDDDIDFVVEALTGLSHVARREGGGTVVTLVVPVEPR